MKWLRAIPQKRIEYSIPERPLLHACSGGQTFFGDITVDLDTWADINADVRDLPFEDDAFAAAFMDPPWGAEWKSKVAAAMKELLRVAPVVYVLSSWVYGSSSCRLTDVKVAWQPGVKPALVFCRYERSS